ncbi:MAG TPA: FIST N-terminal domain-containing protein [Mycobacteriales bacterium]|nr:FIST N-terminal domain-containing protein [Mycobacteriales bacterium]
MARFGDGMCSDSDLVLAAERATEQALAPLGGRRPDLVCVFVCAPDPDDVEAVATRVAALADPHHLIGCTAAGVIGGSTAVEHVASVSVWAAVLPGVTVRTFDLEVLRADDGVAIVGMPAPRTDDRVCLLLGDPYSFPADRFVERANGELPGLPIAGGMASGLGGPGSSRLLVDTRVLERGAVGAMLSGHLGVTTVVSQGCRPVGPSMVVTASDGHTLLSLAGTAALDKLEQVVADLSAEDQALASMGMHLGIVIDEYADEHERGGFLVRNVVGADRERRGVIVGDAVPVGRTVRFQVRDSEAASDDLNAMLATARSASHMQHVEGALLFSCTGRGEHLFAAADHDVAALREHFEQVPVAGFFANGEIGAVGGRNHLHGFTASIVTFSPPLTLLRADA